MLLTTCADTEQAIRAINTGVNRSGVPSGLLPGKRGANESVVSVRSCITIKQS
jgi:hypothetical protein